jgi:hypothetical protein
MRQKQEEETLVNKILSLDSDWIEPVGNSDRLSILLADNLSLIDNRAIANLEETAKEYQKTQSYNWAKLKIALGYIHLYYSKRATNSEAENRS